MLRGRFRAATYLGGIICALALSIAATPLSDWLLNGLERQYAAGPVLVAPAGIIILGGMEVSLDAAEWQQIVERNEAGRFTAGLELAHRFEQARLLYTGYDEARAAPQGAVSTAEIMHEFFVLHGVAAERLTIEVDARNTYENATLLYDMVQPSGDDPWILVTSAFHMGRAMRSFERAGWQNVTAYPVDFYDNRMETGLAWDLHAGLGTLTLALREYLGVAVYWLSGR